MGTSKVIFSLSMSLDGFVAGPNDEIPSPRLAVQRRSREPLRARPADVRGQPRVSRRRDCRRRRLRRRAQHVRGAGRWGGKPPFDIRYFVVTHEPPTEDRGEFTYVTEGVEAAIAQARAAASGKDVSVMGADVPQQAIRAGLLDELVIHLIPVLLDDGKRLFDPLGGRVDLERTQVVEAPEGVTHLRFRVIR
jgi:dihydrofolate reductase